MPKTVAIIGAGCAGLGAAAALLHQREAEVKVTLIDAGGRMGGRARTSADPPGLPVDLGPQFIQDPKVNPWLEIARTLGYQDSQLVQLAMEAIYRIQQGQTWLNSEGTEDIWAAHGQLDKQFQVAAGFDNAPIMTGNAPDFCKGQQALRLALGASEYGAIVESAEPWRYLASDQDRQEGVKDGGANIYVKDGLGRLVQTYGEQLLEDNSLNLGFAKNTAVIGINETESEVSIQTADQNVGYDFCILTIPCSEIEKIKFTPLLPARKARSDSFIALGSYKKVAFRPTAFPAADNAKPKLSNSIEQGIEYYIYDRGLEREGQDGVWQYFRLPTDPTILICVAAGDYARALDGEADVDVAKSVIKLLKDSYPGGNFKPQKDQIVVTNWTKAPYVHGAYSYTRHDDRLPRDDPFPLAARLEISKPRGRLHFAGEATWVEAYGTIHGAYWSGRRAAREILKIIA